jgi:hypothetical protein
MSQEKRVRLRSGMEGWQNTLQANYGNNEDCWNTFCETYHLYLKLGYQTPEEAWEANPVIQGGTIPDDFCKVEGNTRKFYDCRTGEHLADEDEPNKVLSK